MPLPAQIQLPAWVPAVPDLTPRQWTMALAGGVASLAVANYIRSRFFRSSKVSEQMKSQQDKCFLSLAPSRRFGVWMLAKVVLHSVQQVTS